MHQRYLTSLASIKLNNANGQVDLTTEDFNFLTTENPWTARDRSQGRKAVEAVVYGSLDFLGLPRFAIPAEFIAAAIAYFVHPVNIMTACSFMDRCEWSENIINGVEEPVSASMLLAHTIQIQAGLTKRPELALENAEAALQQTGELDG